MVNEFGGLPTEAGMPPEPLYHPDRQDPAYHLRYGWTCWPSGKRFINLPSAEILTSLTRDWEGDGLRVLEWQWADRQIQVTFSATPAVSPVCLAARAKGRLQYALRCAGSPQQFSRKLAVRSIGDNHTSEVQAYIVKQVRSAHFADADFAETLSEFTSVDPHIDLSLPTESARGRYWYNLHIVLVSEGRASASDQATLRRLYDTCFLIAERKGYKLKAISLMPDHLHMALRGDIDRSPQDIALSYQNNLAYALGQKAIWSENFYVGTFGDYDMGAVRPAHRLACQTSSPSGKPDGVER
jgi:REP element-mobilizing transposase RayT